MAKRVEQFQSRGGAGLPLQPVGSNFCYDRLVCAPGPIGSVVGFCGVGISVAIQQAVSKRSQDWFSVLPAYGLQGAPTVRDIDGFVAYLTKVASSIPTKDFKNFKRACGPGQTGNRCVRSAFIPIIHGLSESLSSFRCRRDFGFIRWGHCPIALACVLSLRGFEIIESPEYREPAVGFG